MLYDACGNPIGKTERKRECNLLGEKFTYKILPKDKLYKGTPYSVSRIVYFPFIHLYQGRPRKVAVLKDYEIQVGEDVPERIQPIFGLHEHLHKKDLTHQEIFPYELAAARELDVLEDYIHFMASDPVFRKARKYHCYESEDGKAMTEHRKLIGAEAWMKIENDELVDL
jgi:hypothetical protein